MATSTGNVVVYLSHRMSFEIQLVVPNVEFQFYLTPSSKFITRVKWFMFLLFMFTLLDDFQNFSSVSVALAPMCSFSSYYTLQWGILRCLSPELPSMFNSCHDGFLEALSTVEDVMNFINTSKDSSTAPRNLVKGEEEKRVHI